MNTWLWALAALIGIWVLLLVMASLTALTYQTLHITGVI